MVQTFIAIVVGFLAGRFSWLALRGLLHNDVFARRNYRRHVLPTAGGLVIVFALIVVESFRVVIGAAGIGKGDVITAARGLVLAVVLGFGLLGLLDDLVEDTARNDRGFGGHFRALRDGQVSTGALKFVGGAAIALAASALSGRFESSSVVTAGASSAGRSAGNLSRLVIDAAVIALTANLINLFDRAPGRAIKISALSFIIMLITAILAQNAISLAPVALIVGAALALLFDDLRERMMLGDTGANLLGATIGLGCVLSTGRQTRLGLCFLLLALNMLSEFVSFGLLFDRVVPLRTFDRLGRLRRSAPRSAAQQAEQDH
jgi:UDP-GlcNAc:undecaprenyl-phosphate/decaprenyl-phosphate GlcNAc-1-phosphate transferase